MQAETAADGAVRRARAARATTGGWDQSRTDDVVRAVGWECFRAENASLLARLAVDATRMGDVADLFTLHRKRVLGTLRDMHGQCTVGEVARDPARGTVTWAKPLGVIAVVVPATAPCTAVATNVLSALKTRNAVVIGSHPAAAAAVTVAVEQIRTGLRCTGADPDLVQLLDAPDRDLTSALMAAADFVVATGGRNTVQRAYRSGTPAVSGGSGNATVIVDDLADIGDAASKIISGAAFNNGTSCSSESNVLVDRTRLEPLVSALVSCGGWLCTEEQATLVQHTLWRDGVHDRTLVGRPARVIADRCGFEPPAHHAMAGLIVQRPRPEPGHPLFTEKLTPLVTVAPYSDFGSAVDQLGCILAHSGTGHSCGIYTGDDDVARARVAQLAAATDVCRVMVNQSTMGNAGSFDNGVAFTSTVSSGSWGGCSRSVNITFRHFMNTTTVSYPVPPVLPDLTEIFGAEFDEDDSVPQPAPGRSGP
ncbi:aldehyde dehydrogenase family protein [Rhodococcus sp. NPDC057529]|uniref:aldehyde dehydrogenase family protein n=1 Tax=Rhodococcus sp. NPDC057529 TaxID=3346158 RepID=UPI00366F4152